MILFEKCHQQPKYYYIWGVNPAVHVCDIYSHQFEGSKLRVRRTNMIFAFCQELYLPGYSTVTVSVGVAVNWVRMLV